MFGLSKQERRAKILQDPFPPGWSEILEKDVPIHGRLDEVDRAQLRGLIQVFLAEKVFEGCAGLAITDEIRVTIAAQACMLLLRREADLYPNLITILVYPTAYVSNMPQHGPHGIVTEGPQGRLGEAWTSGVVVLSWDDVKLGAADLRDGHNVVFHEFAHQLDQEDGSSDGAPVLPRRNLYSAWARILGAEYDELRKVAETGKKSVLDTYGATEPAEFFAVATEAFFEKPVQLKKKHPELYEELKTYYGQDPEADFVERDEAMSVDDGTAVPVHESRGGRRSARQGTPCRRFTLLDGLLVIGTFALGFAGCRGLSLFGNPFMPSPSVSPWASELHAYAGFFLRLFSFLILVLRLRRTRPTLRRMACQPGVVACFTVAFLGLGLYANHQIEGMIAEHLMPAGGPEPETFEIRIWFFFNSVSDEFGYVVAVAWSLLALGGRWRSEPGWLDRSGRVVGLCWIAWGIAGAFL